MSTENKPREFWILWKSGYKNQATVTKEKPKEYNDTLTQVIEMAAVEQLKADLRTSDLNRQSLWADSVKMADELNYLKAKTDTEIHQLKSKLEVAKKGLEFYSDNGNEVGIWDNERNTNDWGFRAKETLKEIEG